MDKKNEAVVQQVTARVADMLRVMKTDLMANSRAQPVLPEIIGGTPGRPDLRSHRRVSIMNQE
eukprot:scaffold649529_cov43-Prasinocladus_malaysianus.AAC.1